MKQQLSEEQQAIVEAWVTQGGAMQVTASAGSGKTRVLTESVREILERTPKDKFRIVCLTFTVKAAEEMAERLKDIKGKERATINNIHSFGLEILKAYRHELGYDETPHIIDKEADRKEIIKDIFLENPALRKAYEQDNKKIDKCFTWIIEQKRNLIVVDENIYNYNGWGETATLIYKEYNNQLRNQNLIDYEDILLLAWRILSEKPNVASLYRRIYKYVLVDEAQDLTYAQYQLIKIFCGDSIKNLFMVGDSNQAIHGYAGANKKYFLEDFVTDFSATKKSIQDNYRSSKSVLRFANIIMPGKEHESKQYFEGVAKVYVFNNEEEEADWIITKIKDLLTVNSGEEEFEGQLTLDKIAVLARNKYVFNTLTSQFDADAKLSGNYHLKKGQDVLNPESNFMKVFDLGTRLIANQFGEIYFYQLINILDIATATMSNDLKGIDQLSHLKEYIKESSLISQASFECLQDAWKILEENINNFHKILDDLLICSQRIVTNENEQEYIQKDISEWKEAWNTYIRNVPANSKSLSDFRRFTAMGFSKINTEKGITLATVHTVKGLDFDVVFLIGMTEGTFPDYRANNPAAMEEERNNAYVAVTRAKRHIYITYPLQKKTPRGGIKLQSKSQFIHSITDENPTETSAHLIYK